jgi:sugar/nucleoside kinase (ribokinase family)
MGVAGGSSKATVHPPPRCRIPLLCAKITQVAICERIGDLNMQDSLFPKVDYLVIGNVTHDIRPGEPDTIGGTATYASVTAHKLGLKVGMVTRASADLPWLGWLRENVDYVHLLPSDVTTTYVLEYTDEGRKMVLRALAPYISLDDIPIPWRDSPLVHFGPIAQEIHPNVPAALDGARKLVTPQGWMRCWDENGNVRPYPFALADKILPHIQVMVISEEDINGDWSQILPWVGKVPVLILTKGRDGCTVFAEGEQRDIPPRQANEVDPTGAGDIFAASFLIRWHETGDPWHSAYFANVVASMSIEKVGVDGIPTRELVEEWLEEHPLWER